MNKYQMLDAIIVLLDRLADARGTERCALLVEITKRAEALKQGIKEEESATTARIQALQRQIKDLTSPPEPRAGEIIEGGQTYSIDLTPKQDADGE